ncbi:hypothetical protein HPB50_003988 [Hyalomma asiaticum]|uniref:Uncharacterized protein n=1 Tax=Hyalomma asiaticum TaxID=266040 RepID=A0ACB7TE18_HYAAI|nr:hypothetical protein HPB50_003988 [Hyalomma asiaticum]
MSYPARKLSVPTQKLPHMEYPRCLDPVASTRDTEDEKETGADLIAVTKMFVGGLGQLSCTSVLNAQSCAATSRFLCWVNVPPHTVPGKITGCPGAGEPSQRSTLWRTDIVHQLRCMGPSESGHPSQRPSSASPAVTRPMPYEVKAQTPNGPYTWRRHKEHLLRASAATTMSPFAVKEEAEMCYPPLAVRPSTSAAVSETRSALMVNGNSPTKWYPERVRKPSD